MDSCVSVANKLTSLHSDRTLLAVEIINYAHTFLKFITKFLQDSDTFPSLTTSAREKFLDLSTKVSQTAATDIKVIAILASEWRKSPASTANSVNEALNQLHQQVVALRTKKLESVQSLPGHLLTHRFFWIISGLFTGLEEKIEKAKVTIRNAKLKSDDYADFEAVVEKYIKLCETGNTKYQDDYKKLVAVHKILKERELKLITDKTKIFSQPSSAPTTTATNSNRGQASSIHQPPKEEQSPMYEPEPPPPPSTPSPAARRTKR